MIEALAITGPTASGKTALSLSVAEALGCEILSCDSMQIYKGMDIGTAKATAAEQARVPHHLIDLADPREPFSAQDYADAAISCAEDIVSRGHIPLFVGGTGLYISTLTRASMTEVPKASDEYRDAILSTIRSEEDKLALHERLRQVDPISAQAIHPNNLRRLIRALEIFDRTGKPKSYFDELSRTAEPPMSIKTVAIDFHNRDLLYERIDRRVDIMMNEGLEAEVRALYEGGMLLPDTTAAQAIGYKELIGYLKGEKSLVSSVDEIKQASRNYAKRQLTWWRADRGAIPLFADTDDGIMKSADRMLEEYMQLTGN